MAENPLQAIEYEPPVASAQIKSCVLLAGLNAEGRDICGRTDSDPGPHRTDAAMVWRGCRRNGESRRVRITVSGDASLTANDLHIPADLSSAAFFIVAAAFLEGSEIGYAQRRDKPFSKRCDRRFADLGIDIQILDENEICNEPTCRLIVRGQRAIPATKIPNVFSGSVIANLIDEIPILAIAGTQLPGGLEIRDAAELRIKESDRISAIVENLRRMGAAVEEFEDGFKVERSDLKGAVIDSYGDHRIAMAFAVAGLLAEGETEIRGAESAAVSFPAFFETLEGVIY